MIYLVLFFLSFIGAYYIKNYAVKKSLVETDFHKRLYGSLEVDNNKTKEILDFKNLYTVEDGVRLMLKGEFLSVLQRKLQKTE